MIVGIAVLIAVPIYMHFRKKKKSSKKENTAPDFLRGFVKCTDQKILIRAESIFDREQTFGVTTSVEATDLPQYEIEISDSASMLFGNQLHPVVEGYEFYRGYAFKIGSGIIMIFVGWTPPQQGHIPLVYTKGNFLPEVVQDVVDDFFSKVAYKIGRGFVGKFFPQS